MRKIYTLITATVIVFSASAQRATNQLNNVQERMNFVPKVIPTSNATRAAGDSLFYFDGNAFYGTGISGTFAYQTEDLDGNTVWTAGQGAFGATSSWNFFYDLHSVTSDSLFFMGATSYFTPFAAADNWFEVGPITIPAAGASLSWAHNMPDGNYRDGYKVKVSTTGMANYTDFVDPPIFTVADMDPATAGDTVNTPDNIFAPRSVSLMAYAGMEIYLAFQHDANDMFILYLDDILVVEGTGVGINEFINGVKVYQNAPNPCSSFSAISYELENNAVVALSVYDITGKKIAEQFEGQQGAGAHTLKFNAENLSAGVYYYSLQVGENSTSAMKMVVVK